MGELSILEPELNEAVRQLVEASAKIMRDPDQSGVRDRVAETSELYFAQN